MFTPVISSLDVIYRTFHYYVSIIVSLSINSFVTVFSSFSLFQGLVDCFKSLTEADYLGDRVDVDIWIDRNKDNILDEQTYQTALSFQWPHGDIKVAILGRKKQFLERIEISF